MDINENDFPLYQLLLKLNQPGVENAKRDFAAAQTGTDDQKYSFALGLYGLAKTPDIEKHITGFTPAMRDETLKGCLAVFEDIGSRNHPWGALLSSMCRAYGDGCEQDVAKARSWLEIAEDNGAAGNSFTAQVRQQLGPRGFSTPKQRPPRP